MALNKIKILQYKIDSTFFYEKWYKNSKISRELHWDLCRDLINEAYSTTYKIASVCRDGDNEHDWINRADEWLRRSGCEFRIK